MKGKVILVLTGLFFIVCLSQLCNADLIAHWPFDDDPNDAVGDADGVIYGETIWEEGLINSALVFNGVDNYVLCGTGASMSGTTDLTIAAWIKTTSTAKGVIIQQRNGGYYGEYQLSVLDEGNVGFMLYGIPDGYQFEVFNTTKTVNDGQWHFVAAVREGDKGAIYIDGLEEATQTSSVQGLDANIEVGIGADIRDWVDYFNGSIDDVRLYNHALTAGEIMNLYSVGSGKATLVSPADGAINVHLEENLIFNAGLVIDPADPKSTIVNPDIIKHAIYISTESPDNLLLEQLIDVSVPAEVTVQYDPGTLERGAIYYWRVDELYDLIPGGDPNDTITGTVWSFSTVGELPYFNPDLPVGVFVDIGEDVTFMVEATNPYTYDDTGLSYQWFRTSLQDPNDTPMPCTEPVLTVSNAQLADEGDYFCRVTIDSTGAFADSSSASLAIKRLVAHWPLDNEPNASNFTEDILGDADGVIVGDVGWGTGLIGNAAYFDSAEQMRIEIPTGSINRRNWTLTLWAKVDAENGIETYNMMLSNGPDRINAWHKFYLAAWPYTNEEKTVDFNSVINDEGGFWSNILPRDLWILFAVSYDARTETHSYYMNGARVMTEDKSSDPFAGFGPILSVGSAADTGFSYPYTGLVDDIRLYSYPLSHDEILDLYLEETETEDACVARWPFDGDPNDVIGESDGVVLGKVRYETGLIGDAVYFDGKSTRIEMLTKDINTRNWSISFWMNTPDLNPTQGDYCDIVSNGPDRNYAWGYLYMSAWLGEEDDDIELCSFINNSGGIWAWYYPRETWNHLVTTYDIRTDAHTFYVNGAKIDVEDRSDNQFPGFGPILAVGADADSDFSYPFTGWIDDLRFYNYPLPHTEVLDLYMTALDIDEACINWEMPFYDMNDDCTIDMEDFAYVSSVFSTDDDQADLNGNDIVDLPDVIELVEMWLECGLYPTCIEPEP